MAEEAKTAATTAGSAATSALRARLAARAARSAGEPARAHQAGEAPAAAAPIAAELQRLRQARRAAALAAAATAASAGQGATEAPGGAAPASPGSNAAQGQGPAQAGAPAAGGEGQAERAKVVHLVQRLQTEASRASARKPPFVALSLATAVLLPTFLVALYFLFFAADRFVSEARFALRSNDAQNASVLGMLSGLPATTIVSDSYIVSDYVHSREMVEALERRVGIRAIYSTPRADFFTRLDPAVPLEELVDYWRARSDVYYDSTKNTIAVEVQAFTPEDAQRITAAIVDIVRNLVNDLSAQSRRDAVGFAASEVARAELRVRGARQDMLDFRTANNEFDPTATAAATLQLTSQLEAERSQLNSQLAAVSGYLSADAPSVQMLKSRIAALAEEIGRVQSQISENRPAAASRPGAPSPAAAPGAAPAIVAPEAAAAAGSAAPGTALASVVGKYQELVLSQQFAETAYTAAQASLEAAKTEAARTQSYLAIYVHPHIAEDPAYPRRGLNILMVFILAAVLWAVTALAAMTVRDHMP